MSDKKWAEDCWTDAAAADAGLATFKAESFRRFARGIEPDHPDLAKRYREAAHHLETAAACLDGSRAFATEAELAETRAKYGMEVARG